MKGAAATTADSPSVASVETKDTLTDLGNAYDLSTLQAPVQQGPANSSYNRLETQQHSTQTPTTLTPTTDSTHTRQAALSKIISDKLALQLLRHTQRMRLLPLLLLLQLLPGKQLPHSARHRYCLKMPCRLLLLLLLLRLLRPSWLTPRQLLHPSSCSQQHWGESTAPQQPALAAAAAAAVAAAESNERMHQGQRLLHLPLCSQQPWAESTAPQPPALAAAAAESDVRMMF
jgi:hypothetical protein